MILQSTGLTSVQAKENFIKFGPNEIRNISNSTPIKILLRQIKNNFIIAVKYVF